MTEAEFAIAALLAEAEACPFCGSYNLDLLVEEDYVTCEDCNAFGPEGGIEAWNRRANVQADHRHRGGV